MWDVNYCRKMCLRNVHWVLVYRYNCSINIIIHGRFAVLQPVYKMYTSFCMPFQTCFCWTNSVIQGYLQVPQHSLSFIQAQSLGVDVLLIKERNNKQSSKDMVYYHCCVANTLYAVTFVRIIPNSNNPLYYRMQVCIVSIELPERIILPVSEAWISVWLQTYLHAV
jgi:hypothetical protein